MQITCSNCGNAVKNHTPAELIKDGWRTCGDAAYCPACVGSWNQRNKHEHDNEFESLMRLERKLLKH